MSPLPSLCKIPSVLLSMEEGKRLFRPKESQVWRIPWADSSVTARIQESCSLSPSLSPDKRPQQMEGKQHFLWVWEGIPATPLSGSACVQAEWLVLLSEHHREGFPAHNYGLHLGGPQRLGVVSEWNRPAFGIHFSHLLAVTQKANSLAPLVRWSHVSYTDTRMKWEDHGRTK